MFTVTGKLRGWDNPLLVIVSGLLLAGSLSAADLTKVYKATLDFDPAAGGRTWSHTPKDVWALKSFAFRYKDKLHITTGPSDLVVGRAGSNALWAVVLPVKPGEIKTAPQGADQKVTSIFLRFHPALIGALFPAKTVRGKGRSEKLVAGRAVFQHKIGSSYQWDNTPVIPPKHALILDCETQFGARRFYAVDKKKGEVRYVGAFVNRVVPNKPGKKLPKGMNLEVFAKVWEAFDRTYPLFQVKKHLDWNKLRKEYLPLARKARTNREIAGVVAALLGRLEDLHVYVKVGEDWIYTYNRFRVLNASWRATMAKVGKVERVGKDLAWGRTPEGFGYINVIRLADRGLPEAFDKALDELITTKGLLLDLRFNGGGDEGLAQRIAGRFVDKKRIYSTNRYRNGPGHGDLGKVLKRTFGPRGKRYNAPVAVLCGQKTMSSAESFALMLAQCPQARLIGDRTAGSSANPTRLSLPGGITVNLPRWLDMDPGGTPLDGVGIPPHIKVTAGPKDFDNNHDPVLDRALAYLRKGPK